MMRTFQVDALFGMKNGVLIVFGTVKLTCTSIITQMEARMLIVNSCALEVNFVVLARQCIFKLNQHQNYLLFISFYFTLQTVLRQI